MVIRYEDLSLDPIFETQKLLKFSDLDFNTDVTNWLRENSLNKAKNISENSLKFQTSGRNSTTTPFHWKKHLNIRNVSKLLKKRISI